MRLGFLNRLHRGLSVGLLDWWSFELIPCLVESWLIVIGLGIRIADLLLCAKSVFWRDVLSWSKLVRKVLQDERHRRLLWIYWIVKPYWLLNKIDDIAHNPWLSLGIGARVRSPHIVFYVLRIKRFVLKPSHLFYFRSQVILRRRPFWVIVWCITPLGKVWFSV